MEHNWPHGNLVWMTVTKSLIVVKVVWRPQAIGFLLVPNNWMRFVLTGLGLTADPLEIVYDQGGWIRVVDHLGRQEIYLTIEWSYYKLWKTLLIGQILFHSQKVMTADYVPDVTSSWKEYVIKTLDNLVVVSWNVSMFIHPGKRSKNELCSSLRKQKCYPTSFG